VPRFGQVIPLPLGSGELKRGLGFISQGG
jgi:hypothetical protein